MDINHFLAYVTVSFFTIISPGAAILLAINNGLYYDLRAVLASSLGNILGLFILSSIAMFSVGTIMNISSNFLGILKIVGAVYLIYLGIKQMLNKTHFVFNQSHNSASYDLKKFFSKGFWVAATNPKPILFFTAIFPLFLENNGHTMLQFFIMTVTFMMISLCSLLSYGYLSKTAKTWFFNDNSLKIFYRISGILFILMGIGMLYI